MHAFIYYQHPTDRYRAGRTLRALRALNILATDVGQNWHAALASRRGSAWLLRAGTWPMGKPAEPPASTTRRPLCALGAVFQAHPLPALPPPWAEFLKRTGGHLDVLDPALALYSLYLDPALVAALGASSPAPDPIASLLLTLHQTGARLVRYQPLDMLHDPHLRVAQVVTSLQIGGAERMVLDLTQTLPYQDITSPLIVSGRPTRDAFPTPPATLDVSTAEGGREGRMGAAAEAALRVAADLAHIHLLSAQDITAFRTRNIPTMLTLHNSRPGWTAGTESLQPGDIDLLVACANAVADDVRAANLRIPVRTAWNGIDPKPLERSPDHRASAGSLRQSWGLAPSDFVVTVLANPRPQKRLDRLPAIIEALQHQLPDRHVHLLLAGETDNLLPDAQQCLDDLRTAIAQRNLTDCFHLVGTVQQIAPLLHASDVLLSTSEWEGLSLAHLEALAAGVPVVATGVGGAPEVAAHSHALTCLPVTATPDQFARALVDSTPTPLFPITLPASFRRDRMADRYAQLFPIAIEYHRRRGSPATPKGLRLITNNFSTGGAQSSARRLLTHLHELGYCVSTTVVQEELDHPTPGRNALAAAGIRVTSFPPPTITDPARAVYEIIADLHANPPEAIVFWNLITQYKVLLADLLDLPIFDVSPGEMYYSSLDQYFSNPRPGLPCTSPRQYGHRLAGVIVKYAAEAPMAADRLGCPVHVIPNGVHVPVACPVRRLRGPRLIVGTAARLSPQKRFEELFAALRIAHERLPPYTFRIAGGPDGDNHSYVDQLKREAGDLPIEWLRELSSTSDFLADLDLFVMISEPAGCPNASLEALAAGLPVIATDVGGASEQVVDRVNGRLVPRNNPQALADALVEALHTPALLDAWSPAALAHARAQFTMERMAADYLRVMNLSR